MSIFNLKSKCAAIACCGLLAGGAAQAAVIDIDNAELAKLMAAGVPLVDIRTAPEWQQTGIVPGSHLLTFFDERGRVDPKAWLASVQSLVKVNDPIIVICRTGNRTKALSQFLSEQAGYQTVYNVKNGIVAWGREGRAVAPAPSNLASCRDGRMC